ncbi:MAG: hypothetical protein HY606_12035, partial [Planctomycetes bacterium]|nr:hypothetical protein [Planctomycetota bacterium]
MLTGILFVLTQLTLGENRAKSGSVSIVSLDEMKRFVADGNITGLLTKYNTTFILTENSVIALLGDNSYRLEEGTAILNLTEQSRKPFVLKTLVADIETKEAVFHVTTMYIPMKAILVATLDGSVTVQNKDYSEEIKKNELLVISDEGPLFHSKFSDLHQIKEKVVSVVTEHNSDQHNKSVSESASEILTNLFIENKLIYQDNPDSDKEFARLVKELLKIDFNRLYEEIKKGINAASARKNIDVVQYHDLLS